MIFMPNNGRELRIRGKIAQWIAQARDVAIPMASQFNPDFIRQIYGLITYATKLQIKLQACRNFTGMRKKSVFYIVFFTLLVVGFYFVLRQIIPGYGVRTFQVLNQVRPFSFTDQEGKTVTEQTVQGKVYVAEYFFTSCTGICPILNGNMKTIYEKFRNEPGFVILSHTCDPETDSVARLKRYADSLKVDNSRWLFLTGSKESLYNAARVSYLLDDPTNNLKQSINDQFLHTQFFALVDKNGKVRKKIYDGLKKDELKELEGDIAVLLKEPAGNTRFVNNLFTR
jgi:protein SCO1/2